MKTIVVYNSKTGFTKKYAEWIAQDLGCEMISNENFNNVSEYDLVIYGGWIMGGMISGLDNIKKCNPQKIIAFGVGFTKEDNYVEKIKEINHLEDIPTFYFIGGLNPKKLNFFMKLIVRMATKKKLEYVDYTDRNSIVDLVEYVKNSNFAVT